MKKLFALCLCFCMACSFAAAAAAADSGPDYYADYEAEYGKAPAIEDFPSHEDYQAAYERWFSNIGPYIERRKAEEKAAEAEIPAAPPKTVESAGSSHVVPSNYADASADTGSDDKYPVGSRVDSAGNVFSPSGEILSPSIASALGPDEEASVQSGQSAGPAGGSPVSDVDTLAVIAGLVSDIAADEPVLTIKDLRPANPPAEVLAGMKALVTSIFGEYIPVTTTTVISETVGNDTQHYLVEAVAPGAAGVDYEWVAGVVLFAIMLYCLMRLLGGILK